MSEATRQVRIGDRERRAVDDHLLAAVADGVLTLSEYDERSRALWQARTRGDLERLVADLPPAAAAVPAPRAVPAVPPPPPHRLAAVPTASGDRRLRGRVGPVLGGLAVVLVPAAVLGAVLVAGPDAAAVFGSSEAHVPEGQDDVAVSTLFGSVTVVVPDDARVDTNGRVVFGSAGCADACEGASSTGSADVLEVRRLGAFGSIEILTESEWDLERSGDAKGDEDG